MRRTGFALMLLLTSQTMTEGKLLPAEPIKSRYLGAERTIRIYVPPSYDREPKRRYPVLYLQDGQSVFSSAGANCCYGWGSWELDRIADELIAAKRMQEIIMLAVHNSRSRYQEYRGPAYSDARAERKKLKHKPRDAGAANRFDKYAAFLTKELKPKIDRQYRTLSGPAHTGLMGSSLGGICSLALAWEYPRTFGLTASLSGSFEIEKKHFLHLLQSYPRKPKPLRIYLDSGTIDFTGDDDGRKDTEAVAEALRRIGWKDDVNLRHFIDPRPLSEPEMEKAGLRRDKWTEARKSQHNEFYWRMRAWRALVFLFPANKS